VTARDAAGTPPHRRSPLIGEAGADDSQATDVLQRRIALGVAGWAGVVTAVAVLAGMLLRLVRLDAYVLGQGEAEWAYDAWSLFHGRPLPALQQIPDTSPLFLLVEAFGFFVFGVTDAVARFGAAAFGIGIILLVLLLRPFVSRQVMIGLVTVVAISPTLVYASRTVHPAIAVAFCSLLFLVAFLRAGHTTGVGASASWSAAAGLGLAGMLASGPEGISALIAVLLGLVIGALTGQVETDDRPAGAARAAVARFGRSRPNQGALLGAFVAGVLTLFTRGFSDVTALEGVLTTFADWARLIGTRSSATPQSFFFYAILLYQLFAVVFAIVAVLMAPAEREAHRETALQPTVFTLWFLSALVLQSFSSGRQPDQAVLVALPLALLGGLGLGYVLERVPWSRLWTSPAGLLPLAVLGILIGIVAMIVIVARSNDATSVDRSGWPPLLQIFFVLVVLIIPLAYLIWSHLADRTHEGSLGPSILLVVALVLALFAFRSTTQLAYNRADDGSELLAQEVPTQGVRSFVDRVRRLSRDLSVERLSNIDNTGSYGLSIAVSPEVEWPFAWYFRDFPNMRVAGPAGWTESDDVVIAATPEGMEANGLVIQQVSWLNRNPTPYARLDAGTIFGNVFSPDEWYADLRYLLFRELDASQEPASLSVGYSFRVSNQINPNLGPFDLFIRNQPGPGAGLGQLSSPSGIALSPDGETIYVMDAGNSRIQRFARDGSFIGVWDASTDAGLAFAYQNGQGASALTVGPDGLIYVADTWNHIVVVLDQDGKVVRQLGQRGALTDNGDATDPALNPGLFFGPRGVVVVNDEIFVTDTGNERVQVFGKDGTFLRAFGGFGTGDGQLQEPTGIAVAPDGNIYVADSGNGRIAVFTPAGDFVRNIPVESWSGQLGVDRLNALAFGEDGILYLTTPSRALVEAYDGSTFVTVESPDISRPVGVAVANGGMLLVTDGTESRVFQIEPELPSSFGGGAATPQASPGASPVASPGASPMASPAG